MIDLYTDATSNGRRAAVMLEETGAPYRATRVSLEKGDQKKPDFLKLNPLGQIPVIVDHDGPGGKTVTLSQSGAIALYLAEKTGKLLPKDGAKRALAQQWFAHALSDVGPASGTLFNLTMSIPEKPPASIAFFENRLVGFFRNVDKRLAEAEYLAGELSIADLALYPTYAVRKDLLDKAGGFANLARWAAKLTARPGVQRGMKVPS